MKEIFYNNGIGNRSRRPACVIVTHTGECHLFKGEDIPGVVRVASKQHEKAGKWSNTTYRLLVADNTSKLPLRESWEEGLFFPQAYWGEAMDQAVKSVSYINSDSFKNIVRILEPRSAERMDGNDSVQFSDGPILTDPRVAEIISAAKKTVARQATFLKKVEAAAETDEIYRLVEDLDQYDLEMLQEELEQARRELWESRDKTRLLEERARVQRELDHEKAIQSKMNAGTWDALDKLNLN